jgi:hypothetical protein
MIWKPGSQLAEPLDGDRLVFRVRSLATAGEILAKVQLVETNIKKLVTNNG